MAKKKSLLERYIEVVVDEKLREYSEKAKIEAGWKLKEGLVKEILAAVKAHPENPDIYNMLSQKTKAALIELKQKMNTAASKADNPPKHAVALNRRSHITRTELLAICNGLNYARRFDALMKMLSPGNMYPPIDAAIAGKEYAKKLPLFQTVYKRDRRTLKKLDRLENLIVTTRSQTVVRRVLKDLERKFLKWDKNIQGLATTVVDENLRNVRKARATTLQEATETARKMVLQGKTTSSIMSAVGKKLVWIEDRNLAQIAIRGVITSTYNQTVINRMNYAIRNDLVKKTAFKNRKIAYRFTALIDARTSNICRECHGKIIPAENKAMLERYTPPLHPRCRSMLVPNLRE